MPSRSQERPKENWYNRVAVSALTLAGIGTIAYKMGGPTGRILNDVKDELVEKDAHEKYMNWSRKKFVPDDVKDLKTTIVTNGKGDKILAGGPPTDTAINEAIDVDFNRHKVTDSQLYNSSKRLELDIEAIFKDDIFGTLQNNLMKMKEFRRNHKAPTNAEMAKDMIVAKLKYETLLYHEQKNYYYQDGIPDIDISDTALKSDPYGKIDDINKLHDFYMKNDKVYARTYTRRLTNTKRHMKTNVSSVVISSPKLQQKGAFGMNSVSKTVGSVGELWRSIMDTDTVTPYTSAPDYHTKLRITGSSGFASDDMLRKSSNFEMSMDPKLRAKYSKYMPQLRRIQGRLEQLSNRGQAINNISVTDQVYYAGTPKARSYAIVEWDVIVGNGSKRVTIPIPIENDNVVPSMTNFGGKLRGNVTYVSATPYGIGGIQTRNTTQMALDELHKSLTSSTMYEMQVNTTKFERHLVKQISSSIEDGIKPLSDETRDFFNAHQIRILSDTVINNKSPQGRKSLFRELRSGSKSIRNMQRIKNNPNEFAVVWLDLETINLQTNSAQMQVGDPFTGVWQYGIIEQDMGSGKINRVKQIASDHVLNEQRLLIDGHVKNGTLEAALNKPGRSGDNIRSIARYAMDTVGGENELDALLKFREVLKLQSSVDGKYLTSMYGNPIKNSREFARVIKAELLNTQRRLAKEGKKMMVGTANGYFDLTIIGNLLGEPDFAKQFEQYDVKTVTRALTLGLHDSPALNADNMFPWFASKTGREHMGLMSLSHNPEEVVNAVSNGIILTKNMSTRRTLSAMVRGELSKYAKDVDLGRMYGAHTSALVDNVNALGIMHMQMDFFQKDGFKVARDIEDFTRNSSGYDSGQKLKSFLELELGKLPGMQQWFSFSLMSSNSAMQKIGSGVHIAHMWPMLSLNPHNKDLHQFARHDMIRKDSIKNPHREYMLRNPFQSNIAMKAEEWMTRTSNFDMRYYTNQLQFNMAYAVNMVGSKAGMFKTAADTLDFSVSTMSSLKMHELAPDSKLSVEMTDLYTKIQNKAKDLSKTMGRSNPTDTITPHQWREACAIVLGETQGKLPTFTRDEKLPIKMMVGGKERVINSHLGGRVTSLRMGGEPGKGGTPEFIADILFEANGRDLDGLAVDHLGSKSILSRMSVLSTAIAYGKNNILPDNYAIMNFDFLDKKYWGSMKDMMIRKGLSVAQFNAKHNTSALERRKAKDSYKRIAKMVGASIKVNQSKDGSIRFGPEDISVDPKDIMRRMSAISMNDIVYELGAVGHEAAWTKKTMEAYYNLRGGGDLWKGKNKIAKEVEHLLHGIDSTAGNLSKRTQQVMSTSDQKTLVGLLDPLDLIEQDLIRKNKLQGGSIKEHYMSLNRKQREDLIRGAKLTPFLQALPDLQGGKFLGFYGAYQPSSLYNTNSGKKIKYVHDVKWARSYFEQTHPQGSIFSSRTKQMLSNALGWNGNKNTRGSKEVDVVKKFFRLSETIQNKGLSELATDHALTLDNIDTMIHRRTTMRKYERDILALGDTANLGEVEALGETIEKLQKNPTRAGSINAQAIADTHIERKRAEERDLLRRVKERPNFLHKAEAQEWAALGIKKQDVYFLPTRFEGTGRTGFGVKGKTYGNERLSFVLEDIVSAHNSKFPKEALDDKSFLSMLRLIQKGEAYQIAKKTNNQLFDIVKLESGKHEIHMGGFLMPAHGHIGNIADITEGEFYGLDTTTTKLSREMSEAYYGYTQDELHLRKNNLDAHSERLGIGQLKLIKQAMAMDKKSAMFRATQAGTLKGFQATYKSVDMHMAAAHQTIQDISNGSDYITKWLSKNPKWNKESLTGVLNNFTQLKLNTMTAMTSTLFNDDQVAVWTSGKHISIAEMIKRSDNTVKDAITDMKLGRRTMPGGIMIRFPMLPNGSNPGIEGALFAMPDEIGRGLLGMTDNHFYVAEAVGELVKADNDIDLVAVMMKAFTVDKNMRQISKDSTKQLNVLMNRLNKGGYVKAYNESNFVLSSFVEKGNQMAWVSKISHDGQFHRVKKNYSELDMIKFAGAESKGGLKIEGHLSPLASEEFVSRSNLHNSAKAMGQHIATASLGAYSKTQIGLFTNTIQKKVHEMFMANGAMATKSTVMMAMLGDIGHALAGIAQSPVKSTKHGDIGSVMDMTRQLKWLTDPSNASAEDFNIAYQDFIGNFPEDKKEMMGDVFKVWSKRTSVMDMIKKYDPIAAEFVEQERGIMTGDSKTSFIDYMKYKLIDSGKVEAKLNEGWKLGYDITMNMNNGVRHGISSSDAHQSWAIKLQQEMTETSLDKKFREMYGDVIDKGSMFLKRGGKVAGVAALAFLAANIFRPNQMSNSSNPLDAFVGLGSDIHGGYSVGNDLQLDRRTPLDMVNTSFSKKAYIQMKNDNQAAFRQAKGDVMMDAIKSRYMTPSKSQTSFRKRGTVTYSNLTSNIGIFGSGNHQRRSKNIR